MNTDAYIADFLSRGGSIVKCPTVYSVPIQGAGRINSTEVPHAENNKDPKVFDMKNRNKNPGKTSMEKESLRLGQIMRAKKAQDDASKLLSMYNRGETIEFIAQTRGCSVKRARAILRFAGFTGEFREILHNKGTTTPSKRVEQKAIPQSKHSDEFIRNVAEYYSLGHGTRAIKKKFGCSQYTIMKAIEKHGITARTKKQD